MRSNERERKREMEGREREIDSNDSDVTCEFYKMKPNEMAEKKKRKKKTIKKQRTGSLMASSLSRAPI